MRCDRFRWRGCRFSLTSPSKELRGLDYYAMSTAFLSGGLVVPLVELQASLNEYHIAFVGVFLYCIGRVRKGIAINERNVFSYFSAGIPPFSVYSKTNLADSGSVRSDASFRITGKITHKYYFVVT